MSREWSNSLRRGIEFEKLRFLASIQKFASESSRKGRDYLLRFEMSAGFGTKKGQNSGKI
jgi:hypothetical protein